MLRAVRALRWVLRRLAGSNRWERLDVQTRPGHHGAQRDENFREYLRAPTSVVVASVDDVEAWLRQCTYVRAAERPLDWSTLPITFERTRTGNCVDHALWSWRKLIDLGVAADLVVGLRTFEEVHEERHAWVMFDRGGTRVVLESVTKDPDHAMLRPAADVGSAYWPEFGVDARGARFAYGGVLRSLDARLGRLETGGSLGAVRSQHDVALDASE